MTNSPTPKNVKKHDKQPSAPLASPTNVPTPAIRDIIREKQEQVKNLGTTVELLINGLITQQEEDKIVALQHGLRWDLQKLEERFAVEEADLKIEKFTKVISILKHEQTD